MPMLPLCSGDYTAKINLMTFPMVSANFVMNATASKHLQANILSQTNNELKLFDLILMIISIFKPFRCIQFSFYHGYCDLNK